MYKLTYHYTTNKVKVIEYGFSKYILKRWICLCEQDNVEVDFCLPLCKTIETFWKCLIKKQVIK